MTLDQPLMRVISEMKGVCYCVPNLYFDELRATHDGFGGELDSNGGVLLFTETLVDELHQKTRLTHGGITD